MNKIKDFLKTFDKKDKIIAVLIAIIMFLCSAILIITIVKKNSIKNNVDIKENTSEVEALENNNSKEDINEEKKQDEVENVGKSTNNNNNNSSSNGNTNSNPKVKPDTTKENDSTKVNNNTNNNTSVKKESVDDEVVSYMTNINNDLDSDSKSLKESAKSSFITVVDFIFYDGTIKGHTFKELSSKAKLTVLKLGLAIDSKIDKYFPDYKEKISSTTKRTYKNIKNSVVKKYLEITTSICQKDADTCAQAKKDFQDMKNSFSITWDFIKDLAGSGKASIKEWYEIYSGK